MSKPTTLGEVLDKWEGKGRATFGQTGGAIHDFTQDLRRILYGTDEPCPECKATGADTDGEGYYTCPVCWGPGRLKTPGLVERVAAGAGLAWDERFRASLRREIGEAP